MATQKFHLSDRFVIRAEVLSDRVRFYAEGEDYLGRFLEMVDGGGHIQLTAPGSIGPGTGLELDETGHAVFHLE